MTVTSATRAAGQVIPVTEEPRHHTVLQNDVVRVLDVRVDAKDITHEHTHEADFVFIALGDARVQASGPGRPPLDMKVDNGDVRLMEGPVQHVVHNLGDTVFRNLSVELLGAPPAGAAQGPPHGGEVVLEHDRVRVWRMTLEPGQSVSLGSGSGLLAAVSGGSVVVDGQTKTLAVGDIQWRDGGAPRTVRNMGTTPIQLVDVEVKPVATHDGRFAIDDWLEQKIRAGASKLGLDAHEPLRPPPVLKRPMVMIPGLTLGEQSFDPMAAHYARDPRNGKVAVYVAAEGRFRLDSKDGRPLTESEVAKMKMFQVEYRDAKRPPSEKAPQLDAAFRAIAAATGSPVDVVTHSAGGYDFQLYLKQREGDGSPAIENTVFIGPVTGGTYVGNVGRNLGGILGLDEASAELSVGAQQVQELDQSWLEQRAQIRGEVTVIAVTGAPTAEPGGVHDGDGYTSPTRAAKLAAKLVVLRGSNPTPLAHFNEVHYSGVINAVGDAL